MKSDLTKKIETTDPNQASTFDYALLTFCAELSAALDAEREAREKLEQRVDVLYATATTPAVYDPATCRAIASLVADIYTQRYIESLAGKPLPGDQSHGLR